VFRVVRYAPSLQMLCNQMVLAIPSMLSIIGEAVQLDSMKTRVESAYGLSA
jgi:hypothetical protein